MASGVRLVADVERSRLELAISRSSSTSCRTATTPAPASRLACAALSLRARAVGRGRVPCTSGRVAGLELVPRPAVRLAPASRISANKAEQLGSRTRVRTGRWRRRRSNLNARRDSFASTSLRKIGHDDRVEMTVEDASACRVRPRQLQADSDPWHAIPRRPRSAAAASDSGRARRNKRGGAALASSSANGYRLPAPQSACATGDSSSGGAGSR